jgi:superfamily II DNA or RNA helicase
MSKLALYNDVARFHGSPAEMAVIKDILSYPDKSRSFAYKKVTGKYKEFKKYLSWEESGVLVFPSGHVDRVIRKIKPEIADYRAKPKESTHFRKYNSPTLRDYQEEAVEACIKGERGIIEASTGSGKTVIAAELIYRLEQPTLFIVPTINILKQTYKRLESMYKSSKVGMVGGGKCEMGKDIVIATFQSLLKIQPKHFEKFKVLIIDEAQHCSAETIQEMVKTRTRSMYYRYYFSATPFRNDGSDIALEGVIGSKKLFVYGFDEGSKEGHVVEPRFIIFQYTHKDMDFKKSDYEFNSRERRLQQIYSTDSGRP